MNEYVTFVSGDFTATLDLREIHRLELTPWRKLLKIAAQSMWDNAGNLRQLIDWFDETGIPDAKRRVDDAKTNIETDTWPTKGVNSFQRDRARWHNAQLKEDLAKAKKRAQLLERRRAAIHDTITDEQLEYWLHQL